MKYSLILIIIFVLLSGCDLKDSAVIDPVVSLAAITSANIQQNLINTDTVLVNGGIGSNDALHLSIIASAHLDNASDVTVAITSNDGSDVYGTGQLSDNGQTPDEIANDKIYTGIVSFDIHRSVVGTLQAAFSTAGNGNTVLLPLTIIRKNSSPVLSNLVAPDTVSLGTSIQNLFLSVTASDSDGISNIKSVQFNSFKPDGSPSGGNPFNMYDDGGQNNTSGDVTAGDGIYSLIITLSPSNTKGTYRFEFYAKDFSGVQSNLIIHSIVIR